MVDDTCDLLCLDLPKAEAIRASLPSAERLVFWADVAKALTDATRLSIALSLRDGGSCCVCDLAWIVSRPEKLVSHHLRLLKAAGAATTRRDGRMIMYELTPAGHALVEGLRRATGERPAATEHGIALAVGSVVLMPLLGIAKQRLADRLGSAATRGEGRQNMLCAYLAGALLVGLLANALLGARWLDGAVGLLIAGVAVKEGRDALRGDGCGCCASPLEGVLVADDECRGACCG